MSLEKANIVWSAKQVSGMIKNEKINFEHIIQRSFVWEVWRKSALIESMIIGYPIPTIYAKRIDNNTGKRGDNTMYIMDGKQRLSTVKQFLNDEFALSEIPSITYFDTETDKEIEVDISGKKFSELPDGLKDLLNTVTFNITYFDNLTKEEERELFKRLNQGKPLTAKNKALASAKNIEELLDIGSHELFNQMLTDKARSNKSQAVIVSKVWTMLNKEIDDISFASKQFNPEIEKMEISDDDKTELTDVFDFVFDVHNELIEGKQKAVAKKLYTETHFISLIPFVRQAMTSNINESAFAQWLINFFQLENNTENYTLYIDACTNGVATNMSIRVRNESLNESYVEFFKKDKSTEKAVIS